MRTPFVALTLAVGLVPLAGGAKEKAKPNVVLFLVDDMGWNDIGCTGSGYYETPNIDRLAAAGVRFVNGYSACSVSSPSRASLMTGKVVPKHGITTYIGASAGKGWDTIQRNTKLVPPAYVKEISKDEKLLPEALREGGYTTFMAGKWHIGEVPPSEHGFDYYQASPARGRIYFSPYNNPMLPDGPAGEDITLRLAREIANYITVASKGDKPFFAYLPFFAVHSPIQTTQERWSHFRDKAERTGIAPSSFVLDRTLPVRQTQDNPVYAGLVASVDDAVGIVMDKLQELGLADNTIVIFTSDNGGVSSGDNYSTSNLPLRGGKGRQWDAGTRVPLIIKYPGCKSPGTTEQTPAINMDFYPTILDFAGLPLIPSQHQDGVSLRPLLVDHKPLAPRALYWHFPHYGNQGGEPSSIIQEGEWKLIFYHEDGRLELYNLKNDPGEHYPIQAQNPDRVKAMNIRLQQWLKDTRATMPGVNPRFDAERYRREFGDQQQMLLQREENLRRDQLRPDWQPNDNWWGSRVTVD